MWKQVHEGQRVDVALNGTQIGVLAGSLASCGAARLNLPPAAAVNAAAAAICVGP